MSTPGRETTVDLPLFDEAAASLRRHGCYQTALTGPDLARIMTTIMEGLVAGQRNVRASVPNTAVQIENSQGAATGSVRVESPIQATIKVSCVLGNDAIPSRIGLVDLDIQQEAGFTAKFALRAVNVEQKARQALEDPNQALFIALSGQLAARGVRLTELGLHFNDTTLAVDLRGHGADAGR